MISPPQRGALYPGPLPPVRVQWTRLPAGARVAMVAVPLAVMALAFSLDLRAGATLTVLLVGMAAATGVYVRNRTDRHNAAVESGEIGRIPDPNFRRVSGAELPSDLLTRLGDFGRDRDDLGTVLRFDGGWLVRQRNVRDPGIVLGDDGGWARFDPRTITDLWAVGEYLAGRGRDG